MALVPCPECEKNVSTLATSCPHCGCPLSFTDKASAPPPPPSTLQRTEPKSADDRGDRLREELERFKRRFAATTVDLDGPASSSGIWRQLLDEAEDLLTAVGSRDRYLSLVDAASNLRRLHALVENTPPNTERRAMRREARGRPARPGHARHDEQYESELDSLKRRVEGLEYRT